MKKTSINLLFKSLSKLINSDEEITLIVRNKKSGEDYTITTENKVMVLADILAKHSKSKNEKIAALN